MTRARILITAILVMLAALVFAGTKRSYWLQSDEVSQIVFNDKGCVILISQTDFGWSLSDFQYALSTAKDLLGGANRATARQSHSQLIGIADGLISERKLPGDQSLAGVDSASVYIGDRTNLWRWKNGALEKIDETERDTIGSLQRPSTTESSVGGWSMQYLGVSNKNNNVSCGTGVVSVSESGATRRIELKQGVSSIVLFTLDTQVKRVDVQTYSDLQTKPR